ALERPTQRVDERERADRRDPLSIRGVGCEQPSLRGGENLDETIAIQPDPNLPLSSEDTEREVVEQLVSQDHIERWDELGPHTDPFDRRELRSRAVAPFDWGVGDRKAAGSGEQASSEGPVSGSHLDEAQRARRSEAIGELTEGRRDELAEDGMHVRARDEVTARPDRGRLVEPSRAVERELHELRERDGTARLDRIADRFPRSRCRTHPRSMAGVVGWEDRRGG